LEGSVGPCAQNVKRNQERVCLEKQNDVTKIAEKRRVFRSLSDGAWDRGGRGGVVHAPRMGQTKLC